MSGVGDFIYNIFGDYGDVGVLFGVFLIFLIDALIFPALPEAWNSPGKNTGMGRHFLF